MVCKHCGKEIPDNSKTCPECNKALEQKKKFNLFGKDQGPFEKSIIGAVLSILVLIVLPCVLIGALTLHNKQHAGAGEVMATFYGICAVICLVLIFACIMLTLLPVFNGVDGLLYCLKSWNGKDVKLRITLIFSICSLCGAALIVTELIFLFSYIKQVGLL